MQIPNLTAFRYFDTAAQAGSFVQAAQLLHVTHGAVSRQIRALEESLGVELFERRNRAVFLTPAGRQLLHVNALDADYLRRALRRCRRREED